MYRAVFFGALTLLVSLSVRSETFVPQLLARIDSVEVTVFDQVVDGCLPDAAAAKTAVELELLRSGIEVRDGADVQIWLTFLGGGDARLCSVSHELLVMSRVHLTAAQHGLDSATEATVPIYQNAGLLTGAKSRSQQRAVEKASEMGRALSVEMLKLRQ